MFVLQTAVVKGHGGIATAVAHYERMFRAVGVRSAVVFRGPSRDQLRAEGFDVFDAPHFFASPVGGVAAFGGALQKQVSALAHGEPIVVIAHSDRTLPSLKRMFPGACLVVPCHSDKLKHKGDADLLVTLNATQQLLARKTLATTRAALLGNPYVAPQPPSLALEGSPRLNFVARFIATKDPLTLLRAAALMHTAPRPEVRFIGAGELEAEMRTEAAKAPAPVTFAGWLNKPFSEFHRHDVLVLPSAWEGLPYLLQEALDHGVPIIAADNPGNRAALGEGAYGALFPFGDAVALARACDAALADLDGLRAKAEKGREALVIRYAAQPFWEALKVELDDLGEPHV